jgi:hypothetical protein
MTIGIKWGKNPENIHVAAHFGFIEALEAILKISPHKIDLPDKQGLKPLMYAARNQQLAAVRWLLDHNANPDLCDNDQLQKYCWDYALNPDGTDTPLSLYIKERVGFSEKALDQLCDKLTAFIKTQIALAHASKKPFLLILGENHYHYKIEQLEKRLVEILSKLGINNLLDEHIPNHSYSPMAQMAEEKFHMSVMPIDSHPHNDLRASISMRNIYMAKNVNEWQTDAFMRIGSSHFLGLLTDPFSKIDPSKKYIVPLNLSSLVRSQPSHPKEIFAHDPNHVIQMHDDHFSDPSIPLAYWNGDKKAHALDIAQDLSILHARKLVANTRAQFTQPETPASALKPSAGK